MRDQCNQISNILTGKYNTLKKEIFGREIFRDCFILFFENFELLYIFNWHKFFTFLLILDMNFREIEFHKKNFLSNFQ